MRNRKPTQAEVNKAVRITRSVAGSARSELKAISSRENGKLGGRPSLGIGDARQIYRDLVKELYGDLRKLPKDRREAAREDCRRRAVAEVERRKANNLSC